MPDADNHAGEQNLESRGSDQQKKTNHKNGQLSSKRSERGNSSGSARNEVPKDSQDVRNDNKSSQTARGPEDWGGYDGY